MKTSTNKQLAGWRDTFEPRNLNIKVADWLRENNFGEEDAESIDESATFADFQSCICGHDHELSIIDTEKMARFCNDDVDTFLRDAIYSAIKAIA